MGLQLVMGLVVEALHGRLFERAVHPLDLAVGPRMVWLGEPVLDVMGAADLIEAVDAVHRAGAGAVLGQLGELDAVVGQHRVEIVGTGGDQRLKEGACGGPVGLGVQLSKDELARAVDGDEEVQLAFLGADLGDVDVERVRSDRP